MTNRPATIGKRILAALMDFLIIYMLVMVVTFILSLTPLGDLYNDAYNQYKILYDSYAVQAGVGRCVESNSTSIVSIISSYTSSMYNAFTSAALADTAFVANMNTMMKYYFIINVVAIAVVESIFLLLIPMLSKKGQTVGKMMMGLAVIDIRYDMYLSKKNKAIRFAMGFFVETLLILFLFRKSDITMVNIFSPLLVFMTIMMSQQKQALHDVVSHAKVVDLRTATIFESIEEKEAYDAELLKQEDNPEDELDIIDTEIEEVEEEVIDDEDDPFMKEEEKEVVLEKTSVFINSFPKDKLKEVVFEIQGVTSLSTIEAKRLLDNLPALVKTGLEEDEAIKIKETLDALGVEVEIK